MWKPRPNNSSLVCALFVSVGACAGSSPPAEGLQQTFVYEKRIGLARWHANRGCLAVFDSSITPRTRVMLVHQPDSGALASVTEATVVKRVSPACDAGLSGPNNKGITASFYQIATADSTTPTEIMFAILAPSRPVVVRNGRAEVDLDEDDVAESFRVCNSAENVHFMIWTGLPAQGQPRWQGLYYVGYDMTPSCTEQDVAGMVTLEKRGTTAR
jgi:hypothetical protein